MAVTKIIRRIRDTRFGRKPRNPVEALRQARAFLVAEGKERWIKGAEFAGRCSIHGDLPRNFDPENPLCGSWGVCAIGSVGLVTGDLAVKRYNGAFTTSEPLVGIDYEGTSEVYKQAVRLLDQVAPNGDIVSYNDKDGTKRKQVIKQFDAAIALGQRQANERRGRNSARTKARTLTGMSV